MTTRIALTVLVPMAAAAFAATGVDDAGVAEPDVEGAGGSFLAHAATRATRAAKQRDETRRGTIMTGGFVEDTRSYARAWA